MNPVQYIIMKPNSGMSEGKARAQAAHASVEGLRVTPSPDGNPWGSELVQEWYSGGHYAKIVLAAHDLQVSERYIRDRGFNTALIIDEGRTEFDQLTPTAIGVQIVDKDTKHVRDTFSVFKLYRDDAASGKNTRPMIGRVIDRVRRKNVRRSSSRTRHKR